MERASHQHDVIGVDCFLPNLYEAGVKRVVADGLTNRGLKMIEADLRYDDLDDIFEGADAIIHEAGMAGLGPSWNDLETYLSCNIAATERVAKAALAAGVQKFIQISTSSVYGKDATGGEDSPLTPFSPYGVSKLAAEHLLHAYRANFGLPLTVLRYFSIYGPRQRPDMAYHKFIESVLDDQPISVYGDGFQTRTNTYVDDCVNGTLLALEHGADGETYNIGGGVSLSLLEAIEIIGEACGRKPKIEFAPERRGDQRHTAANIDKATRELGYVPIMNPDDGLHHQVAWHRRQRYLRRSASAAA